MQPDAKRMKMNSISESLIKSIKCCIRTEYDHFADDAHLLQCGGNACKKCIDYLDQGDAISCKFCDTVHTYHARVLPNPHIRTLIKSYMDDLKQQMVAELNQASELFKADVINEQIEFRFHNIKCEVETHIESIIIELHEYRDDFMREIEKIKERYEKYLNNDEIKKTKTQLDSLKTNVLTTDYDEFMSAHNKMNESKELLNKYLNELKQIKFEPNDVLLNKDLVGQMTPFSREIEITGVRDAFMYSAYSMHQNKLFISDTSGRALIIYDVDLDTVVKFTHEEIKQPRVLCFGQNDQLFLFDSFEYRKVLIFDKDLKCLKRFPINDFVTSMDVDLQTNLLYLCENSKISLWNPQYGELIKATKYQEADCIKVHNDFIYCIRHLKYDENNLDGLMRCYNDDLNSVRILNKFTFDLIDTIFFDNWLQPFGLHIDNNGYLLTMAYALDANKYISSNKYLYVINRKKKEIVEKVKIDCKFNKFSVFCAFDNKISIVNDTKIKLIEFDRQMFYN